MVRRSILFGISIAALCVFVCIPSWAQLQTGTISGTVTDVTGAVIPGTNVTLSAPGIGTQATVSDDRGTYRFIKLVPATYSIKVELPGFRNVMRENLVVNADVTVRADVKLEVGAVADTIMVTGEAPLLDTTTALNQAFLDSQLLKNIPNGNDLWSLGRTVPGIIISKYDIGGSQAFQQSTITAHGSPSSEVLYAVDGLDTNTPAGSGGSMHIYYDVNGFEEVNYQSSGISAENARGGVIVNMVSKTGTDNFHGGFSFQGSNTRLQSNNLTPDLTQQLLAGVPALARATNPNLVLSSKTLGMFESNFNVGGPIARGKLWFFTSERLYSGNNLTTGNYTADGKQGVDDNRIKDGVWKFTWQVSPKHRLNYLYILNLKDRYHRYDMGGATFVDPRAARWQNSHAYITQLKWNHEASSKLLFDAMIGYSTNDVPYIPTDKSITKGDTSIISHLDIATSTVTVANAFYQYAPITNGRINASMSYFTGSHDIKAGYQFSREMERPYNYSTSDMQARFRNGAPDSVTLLNTPNRFAAYVRGWAVFLQDNWKVAPRLTANLGLRLESKFGYLPKLSYPGGRFLPAQTFSPIKNVPNFLDLAPRFGMAYDIFGNGRAAVKLSVSRYDLNIGTEFPERVSPVQNASSTVPWNDKNGDLIPQLDELGIGTGFDLGVYNRYSPDMKRPYTNEYSIGLQYQLPGNVLVSGMYFHRDVRRNIGMKNVAVPMESYIPISVIEPTTGRQATVYNLNPALRLAKDYLFNNYSEMDNQFNGFDLSLTRRMNNHWQLFGGLSIGDNRGDVRGAVDLNDPNNNFRRGPIGNDVPLSFKVSGTYELPVGLTLSGNFQHFTGFPDLQIFQVTQNLIPNVVLTRTSQAIYMVPRGDIRYPNNNITDLSIAKRFKFHENMSVSPELGIFNLTNSNVVQSRGNILGTAYLRPAGVLPPRLFRLGFRWTF